MTEEEGEGPAVIEIEVLGEMRAMHSITASEETLYEALADRHQIETELSLLKCVDGVCNSGDDLLWTIELNGVPSPKSMMSYRLRPGDHVVVRYSEMLS